MEGMDRMNDDAIPMHDSAIPPEIQRLFAAKEARRRELAALPWPEKVRMIVKMQEMLAPILRARGIEVKVWPSEDAGKSRCD